MQKFGVIKLHNPKGTTAFATLSHFVPFAKALSLPSSIFWAGNQCGIAAASYSLMMNMWRPWNVGAFISHPPQLTICQSQRMPFLSFSVQALVPTCLLLPAICICIFKHDFSTFRINNVFCWLLSMESFSKFFIPQ